MDTGSSSKPLGYQIRPLKTYSSSTGTTRLVPTTTSAAQSVNPVAKKNQSTLVSEVTNSFIMVTDEMNNELWSQIKFERECKFCKKFFDCKIELLVHESCYTTKRKLRELFLNPPTKDFDCEICWTGYDTFKDLKEHGQTHFGPSLKCNLCEFTNDSKPDMETHCTSHPKPKVFGCIYPGCNLIETFLIKDDARNHIKETHFPNFDFSSPGNPTCPGPIPVSNQKDVQSRTINNLDQFVENNFDPEDLSLLYKCIPFPMDCKECKNKFDSAISFTIHEPCFEKMKLKQVKEGKPEFTCVFCPITWPNYGALHVHVSQSHQLPNRYKCTKCDFKTKFEPYMIDHTQEHSGERIWSCKFPGCKSESRYKNATDVRTHIKRRHVLEDLTLCRFKECLDKFASIEDRKLHESVNHPNFFIRAENKMKTWSRTNKTRNLKRRNAERMFYNRSSRDESPVESYEIVRKKPKVPRGPRKQHEKSRPKLPEHIVVPSFQGDSDSQATQLREWMQQFAQKLETQKKEEKTWKLLPFEDTCKLCNKTWNNKATFIVHDPCYYVKRSRQLMEDGVEEAPRYQCDLCGADFVKMDRLRCHMTFHFDPEIECIADGCGKLFHNDFQARSHYDNDHCKLKRYLCTIDPERCVRKFKSLTLTIFHIERIHLGLKYFACTEEKCGMTFGSSKDLRRHVGNIHGEEQGRAECPLEGCKMGIFEIRKKNLVQHIKRRHPNFDLKTWLEDNPEYKAVPTKRTTLAKMDILNGEAFISKPSESMTQVTEVQESSTDVIFCGAVEKMEDGNEDEGTDCSLSDE